MNGKRTSTVTVVLDAPCNRPPIHGRETLVEVLEPYSWPLFYGVMQLVSRNIIRFNLLLVDLSKKDTVSPYVYRETVSFSVPEKEKPQ